MMDYTTVISNVGFPIATAIYFMFRFEKKVAENTEALTHLKEVIIKCKK